MLRIIQTSSVAQAKSYYTSGLSREDYYAEGQECVGRWGGRGAALLGLKGPVDSPAFVALCDNQHPRTGGRLTARTKADRTVGYDFNFHAPKSVSVVYELTRDERIAEAFRESVDATMRSMEAEVRTRVRRGGANAERTTANLTWATFEHHTARPVNGVPDPHLHEHVFVFNSTFDAHEGKWKAAQFRELKRDAPYFEACFHAGFAERLRGLGYGIERTDQGWELSGVPESVTEKFSRRTQLIDAEAKRRGLTDDRQKDGLGAKTCERKSSDLTRPELRKEWNGFVAELPDDRRYTTLATDYIDALTRNKTVLVVAPTHAEGEQVTQVIRDRLKADSLLDEKERPVAQLKSRNWTEAERADAARYHAGDVVHFLQNAKGVRRGERLSVDAVEDGVVWLQRNDGRIPLPLTSAKSYQVYAVDELGLAQGDRLRITQNGATRDGKHRLNNGAHYAVAGFTSRGDVKLTNGWTVDRDFGHWAYGYAATSHASQGKTVDQVFVAQSSTSLPASSLEQFYVSCSRAKEKVVICTDDKAALKAAIQESTQRLSATELLAEPTPAPTPTWRERAAQQFERVRQYGHQLQAAAREAWQQHRETWAERMQQPPQREQSL